MAYNYGPPPPAPPAPPAAPPVAPGPNGAGYQPYYQPSHRGGYVGQPGHGGVGRGRGGHAAPPPYGYPAQHPAQPYGMPAAAPYPTQGAYPLPPQQQLHPQPQTPAPAQQPQQWHHEQAQHQPGSSHALPAQNYHPNYAPQLYQQAQQQAQPHASHQQPQPQAPYSAQPPYPPAPSPYGPAYQAPVPVQPGGPPAPHWGQPSQPAASHGQFGTGRGRGGYSDRGGKPPMMGPPIRLGFDSGNHQPPAPVSNPYSPAPYAAPSAPPVPYPPPAFQGYPPPASPYAPGPAHHEGGSSFNSRSRSGFHHNNMRSRNNFGGDKMRNRGRGFNAQTPPNHHQKPDAAATGKKKKRKTNTLGLTPGDDSEEDDENEEQRLNQLYGADAPNPTGPAAIAEWIAERRANYPTKARVEAKKNEARQETAGSETSSKLEQKAERLRKQLEMVESSIKRKRELGDEGDEMRDVELNATSSDDGKSADEKPDVLSTRPDGTNSFPPASKKADPTKQCKYYSTGGTCGKKGKCRFVHDPAVREAALKEREMNGGRMTLQQRLILNDKDQEDLTIVQTLHYLQNKGMMTKTNGQPGTPAATNTLATMQPSQPNGQSESPNLSLPPIPPTSALPQPPVAKYNGWNLSGFGNTGSKSDM